jgi:type IV secretory pathway VirB6-like protein
MKYIPSWVTTEVDVFLNNYIYVTGAKLWAVLTPTLFSMLTLSIVVMGILMIMGKSNQKPQELIWWSVKVGLIVGLFNTLFVYMELFVNFFFDFPTQLTQFLSLNSGATNLTTSQLLDRHFSYSMELAQDLIFKSDWYGSVAWGQKIAGIVFVVIIFSVFGFVTYLIITTKVILAVLLALTPLFVMFALFDKTKGMTEAWLQQMLNAMFVSLFIGIFIGFNNSLMLESLKDIDGVLRNKEEGAFLAIDIDLLFGVMFLTSVGGALYKIAPILAQAIAGGIASSGALSMNLSGHALPKGMPSFGKPKGGIAKV